MRLRAEGICGGFLVFWSSLCQSKPQNFGVLKTMLSDSFSQSCVSNGEIIVNGTGTLQVIDILGRVIFTKELSPLTSHLSLLTFKPGVYVLRLIGEQVKAQKIVVK